MPCLEARKQKEMYSQSCLQRPSLEDQTMVYGQVFVQRQFCFLNQLSGTNHFGFVHRGYLAQLDGVFICKNNSLS